MTDLYDQAASLPLLLRGDRTPRRWAARRFRGAYLLGCAPADLLDRLRAALLVLPASSVLSHHTAALLYGFGVLPSRDVHVIVPAGSAVPQRRGIAAHECVLPIEEVVEVCGLPCVSPARCATDLARAAPRHDALAVLDAALRAEACKPDDLLAETARHDRLRGVRQARELMPLASPLAECRQETHVRLLLHDARLPMPQPQLAVVDRWGVERHRIDLGYEEEQVGLELQLGSEERRRDHHRHNWLAANGWRLRYFTEADIYHQADRLVQTVRAALCSDRSRSCSPIRAGG
jgi:very-short-patch-repair endonuclease